MKNKKFLFLVLMASLLVATPLLIAQSQYDAFFGWNGLAKGNATFQGDVTLGDSAADTITITGTLSGAVSPNFTDGIDVDDTTTNASDNVVDIDPAFAGGATDTLTYTVIDVSAFSPSNSAGTDTVNAIKIGNLTDPGATITSVGFSLGSGFDTDFSFVDTTPLIKVGATLLGLQNGSTGGVVLNFHDYADTTDDDMAHSVLTTNCTDASTGAEDCDYSVGVVEAGAAAETRFSIDADGDITLGSANNGGHVLLGTGVSQRTNATGSVTYDFRDYGDTTDDDMAHSILTTNCTDTGTGADDCDFSSGVAEAGTAAETRFSIDADGGITIGSANNNSFTATTDGTGDGETVLSAESVGAAEILNLTRAVNLSIKNFIECTTDAGADINYTDGADAFPDFICSSTNGLGCTLDFDDTGGSLRIAEVIDHSTRNTLLMAKYRLMWMFRKIEKEFIESDGFIVLDMNEGQLRATAYKFPKEMYLALRHVIPDLIIFGE